MSEVVVCDVHGDQDATIVCVHIADSLGDGLARGFRWCLDEDGEYQATCDSCSDMTDEAWEAAQVKLGRVLCFGCYSRAATLNGISIASTH